MIAVILYSQFANEELAVILKPQDVLFLLKLVAIGQRPWTFSQLAIELGMSASEVHAAARRALAARLAVKEGNAIKVNRRNLEEFLLHGIQYVFVPDRKELSRGMPTAYAAPPLDQLLGVAEFPPVWPDAEGEVRGESFSPLYKSAPTAARNDPGLYRLLALVDAIRGGQAQERELATREMSRLLGGQFADKTRGSRSSGSKILIGGQIEVARSELRELAKRFHIRRLHLFGSAARDELKADSDIDLLVEFEENHTPSMGGMDEITRAFERLFDGRKIDIATPSIMKNPYRRQAIERDMEELYAA